MNDTTLWVFGYGSLIWEPDFAFQERLTARLTGWHRSFCMYSVHYRGTPTEPGLVLALDAKPGAVCDGVAFGVAAGDADAVLGTVRARELISAAYLEQGVTVVLSDGRRVDAVTFVINRDHPQYAGDLPPDAQARIIAASQGVRGPNADYLWNTASHLAELGFADADLDWLAARVRVLTG
jgi:glutathione-specific gamma-glutamylcyclotransferase